jgi:hypothetical protein
MAKAQLEYLAEQVRKLQRLKKAHPVLAYFHVAHPISS